MAEVYKATSKQVKASGGNTESYKATAKQERPQPAQVNPTVAILSDLASNTIAAKNKSVNYVTNSKGETVIPNTDPVMQKINEREKSEALLTSIGSAFYDEDYKNQLNFSKGTIPLNDKLLVESAKKKIATGGDLNSQERNIALKYGIENVFGDTIKGQYDIFAADNPYNISRSKRFKEYAQKEMNGGTLTEAEQDAIETFKLLENYKKQTATEEFKMTGDIKSNSKKLANIAARSMYNDTAYGGTIKMGDSSIKIDELPIASDKEKEIHTTVNKLGNQLDLYTKTGLANYFVNTTDGLKTGWNIITGQDTVSDLKDKIDTPYAIASAVLKQHFTENGERVNMMLQDTVTNMAQNAIPMTAAILTAGMGGGALLTQFVSTAAFAPSVFGGAYKEGIQKGVTDPRKLFAYATITTVAECGLEAALGASFNPAGGVLTGEIVSSLSSKFSNVFAKAALKVGGNAIGEFVEESAQSILSPLLTEVILGVDDTTFFDDPIGSLSQAAYEGLIGALSASLMGGPSNIADAVNESSIQAYGKNYKDVVQQVGADINNIAAYFKEVSQNKNLTKLCDKVLNGDHSDLTIGEMLVAANQLSKSAAQQMYSKIGEKITALKGGVDAVLSIYDENVNNGAIYPDNVSELYNSVKTDNSNGTVKDVDVGRLAVEVQAYAPRSLILGQTLEKLEAENSVLQSNANSENVQYVGVSGTNNGVSGNADGVSGSFSGVSGQNSGTVADNSKIDSSRNYTDNSQRRKKGERLPVNAAEQAYIKRICDALGIKMQFVRITTKLMKSYGYDFTEDTLPDGFYNKEDKTLYIGFTGYDPVKFVLKHELTHFGEGTKSYKNFVDAVRESRAYRDWLVEQGKFNVEEDSFTDIERTVIEQYVDKRKAYEPNFKPEDAKAEMVADFVGKYLFDNNPAALERMMSGLNYEQAETVWQHIKEFFAYLKRKLSGEKNLVWEITRLENQFNRMLSEAVETKKAAEDGGGNLSFHIINLDSGKSYVRAARKIITGNSVAEWRSQISKFFNDSLKNGPIQIQSMEGDTLTISKDTADKARDKHITENGITRELTDKEFFVKLNAEAHIDELVEISHRNKGKIVPDGKNHSFAKDGFTYRTVYFQDFDGAYYRITLSVGENGGVSTVYNVGKMKADDIPNGNIVSAIGSKADMSSANSRISQSNPAVKNNILKNDANNSDSELKFTISRALNNDKIQKAEEMENELKGAYDGNEFYQKMDIWKETGLVRDPSGVWVYEIDDGKMRFYPKGDRFKKRKAPKGKNLLINYLRHKELFERYPQLNDTELVIYDFNQPGKKAAYWAELNYIVLDKAFAETASVKEVAETLVHEIQHAAQRFDEREGGANIEYWNQRLKLGTMPKNPKTGKEYTPYEAYMATRGEYEARMSEGRLWMDSDEKKEAFGMPFYDAENTVSVENELAGVGSKERTALKFSIPTDREYSEAVENGDNDTLQQMVDDKAKASGYTERLYHQTDADFTEFNTDNQKAGKYDWELPTGMFLKPSNDDIGLKGKKQMNLYAKQRNPLKFSDRAEAQQYWRDNVEGYAEAADKILGIDTEYRLKSDAASYEVQSYMKHWRLENPNASRQAIYNDAHFQELHDKEALIFEEWEAENDKASLAAKKLIDNYIAESDYDGVVLESDIGAMGRSTKTYIVFDSAQLKDASPVTYDDSGKVIPLSERFNGDKKDIRFTVPTRNLEKENQDLRQALVESQELTDKVRENLTEHYESQMNRLQKRYDDLKKKLSSIHREASVQITKQREERADKTRNIDCIRRSVSRMDAKLRSNTDAKHVPQELKQLAHMVIATFRFNDTSPFERKKLHAVKAFYNDAYETAKNNPDALNARYDEQIVDMLVRLEEHLEGKTLRKMTLSETSQVRSIVEHIEWLINNENKLFIVGKKRDAIQVGLEELADLTGKSTKRVIVGTEALEKVIKYNNMTPVYFFDEIGGSLRKVFGDIVKGQDKWYRNIELAKAYILDIKEKYHYSEWENDTFSFTTEHGDNIEITREQALLLYATARREYGNNLKNTQHLFEGGVVIPPSEVTLRSLLSNYKRAVKEGTPTEAAMKTLTRKIDSAAHKIAKEDVMKVFDWLTEEQVAYADAFVEYLSNDMALLGNETSMEIAGFKEYNESYYIPYNSASNFIAQHSAVTSDAKLKHQSFTKSVSPRANTPLILSNFSELCVDHINRMCMYNALTVPLETMEKIMNFKMPSTDNEGNEINSDYAGKSVSAELERVYGADAVKYIRQFIDDTNGNVRKTEAETPADKLVSKFKKGAVMASASVVVQQPSAIMRAMAYINPKYFFKTERYNLIKNYEELVEYVAVAGIKEMGRFDTSTGVSTTKWLLQETPKGAKNKAKAFFDIKDSSYRDDILSLGAAWADQITWGHIWAAVKAEVVSKSQYAKGSKEFYEACAARFTFIINHTQVYDSTLSRSHLMRSKNIFDNMVSSFMSEPTVSLNMLMSAARAAGTKTKVGKKFAGRAVAAFVGNVLLNTALKSLVTAARDDDEDETYLEKYISAFVDNFVQDINPLNLIPYVKDLISIFEGYTVERADMSLVDDLAQSIKMLSSDNKTIDEKLESLAGSLSAFFGVPTKNVLRDLRAAWNVIDMAFISKPKGDLQGAIFAVTGTEGGERYEALAEAAEKGNDAEYQRIYKHLIDSGLSDEDIKTNVQKLYRKDKDVVKQTETYMKELANNKTYQGFDAESKKEIESDITGILAKEKTVEALVKEPDRFDKLYEAKRKSKAQYEKLKKEMLAEGMSESLIKTGEEIAKVAYMKTIGINIKEYYLFKMAMSEKYADTDGSGGVSNKEKRDAAKKLDIDAKAKQWLMKN
ncbi:MAG: hypothetical protein J6B80_04115 [Clostridia bacterium]|nr:hypothetical protein [Clostridia bacterium]